MNHTICLVFLSLSLIPNTIFSTSPNAHEQKIKAQAFFIVDEIPPIGNLIFEEVQIVQVMQAQDTPQTELIQYYAIEPNIPWSGAY